MNVQPVEARFFIDFGFVKAQNPYGGDTVRNAEQPVHFQALRKNLIDPLILQGFVESAVPVPWPAECS